MILERKYYDSCTNKLLGVVLQKVTDVDLCTPTDCQMGMAAWRETVIHISGRGSQKMP